MVRLTVRASAVPPEWDRSLHIDLDLQLHGSEVHGRAVTDGRPARSFVGWVGLLAALDALIEPPAAPGG